MSTERDDLAEVEILARWLHDEVGGCCVDYLHNCVFGGDEVRKEAADLLTTGALAGLLAARDRRVRAEAAEAVRELAADLRAAGLGGTAAAVDRRANRIEADA